MTVYHVPGSIPSNGLVNATPAIHDWLAGLGLAPGDVVTFDTTPGAKYLIAGDSRKIGIALGDYAPAAGRRFSAVAPAGIAGQLVPADVWGPVGRQGYVMDQPNFGDIAGLSGSFQDGCGAGLQLFNLTGVTFDGRSDLGVQFIANARPNSVAPHYFATCDTGWHGSGQTPNWGGLNFNNPFRADDLFLWADWGGRFRRNGYIHGNNITNCVFTRFWLRGACPPHQTYNPGVNEWEHGFMFDGNLSGNEVSNCFIFNTETDGVLLNDAINSPPESVYVHGCTIHTTGRQCITPRNDGFRFEGNTVNDLTRWFMDCSGKHCDHLRVVGNTIANGDSPDWHAASGGANGRFWDMEGSSARDVHIVGNVIFGPIGHYGNVGSGGGYPAIRDAQGNIIGYQTGPPKNTDWVIAKNIVPFVFGPQGANPGGSYVDPISGSTITIPTYPDASPPGGCGYRLYAGEPGGANCNAWLNDLVCVVNYVERLHIFDNNMQGLTAPLWLLQSCTGAVHDNRVAGLTGRVVHWVDINGAPELRARRFDLNNRAPARYVAGALNNGTPEAPETAGTWTPGAPTGTHFLSPSGDGTTWTVAPGASVPMFGQTSANAVTASFFLAGLFEIPATYNPTFGAWGATYNAPNSVAVDSPIIFRAFNFKTDGSTDLVSVDSGTLTIRTSGTVKIAPQNCELGIAEPPWYLRRNNDTAMGHRMDQLRALGVVWLRVDLDWFNAAAGNWTDWDNIASAWHARFGKIHACLAEPPGGSSPPDPTNIISSWAGSHQKPDLIEIMNETNLGTSGWDRINWGVTGYGTMLVDAYNACTFFFPDRMVLVGGLAAYGDGRTGHGFVPPNHQYRGTGSTCTKCGQIQTAAIHQNAYVTDATTLDGHEPMDPTSYMIQLVNSAAVQSYHNSKGTWPWDAVGVHPYADWSDLIVNNAPAASLSNVVSLHNYLAFLGLPSKVMGTEYGLPTLYGGYAGIDNATINTRYTDIGLWWAGQSWTLAFEFFTGDVNPSIAPAGGREGAFGLWDPVSSDSSWPTVQRPAAGTVKTLAAQIACGGAPPPPVDTTPPANVQVSSPAANAVVGPGAPTNPSSTLSLVGAAQDPESGLASAYFQIDGGAHIVATIGFGIVATQDLSGFGDGSSHSVTLTVTNGAGLSGTSSAVSFTVKQTTGSDTTAPVGPGGTGLPTLSAPSPSSTGTGATPPSSTVSLAGQASDPDTGISSAQFIVDGNKVVNATGSGTNWSATPDISTLQNGSHSVVFRAFNGSNLSADSAAQTFTVTNVLAPPPPPDTTRPQNVAVVSPTTASIWGTGASPPTQTIDIGGTASDPESGISSAFFNIDGGPAIPASLGFVWVPTTPVSAGAYSNGTHTITFTAVNGAGLSTTSPSVSFQVQNSSVTDTTAPTGLSITAPTDGLVVGAQVTGGSSVLTLSGTATDPETGISSAFFSIDASVTVPATLQSGSYNAFYDTTRLLDGGHTVSFTAVNGVGLSATAGPVSITVDNLPNTGSDSTPPTNVTIEAPVAGTVFGTGAPGGQSVVFRGNAVDPESGIAGGTFAVTGPHNVTLNAFFDITQDPILPSSSLFPSASLFPGSTGAWTANYDASTLPNGSYSAIFTARDGAGLVQSSSAVAFVVSNGVVSPPPPPVIVPPVPPVVPPVPVPPVIVPPVTPPVPCGPALTPAVTHMTLDDITSGRVRDIRAAVIFELLDLNGSQIGTLHPDETSVGTVSFTTTDAIRRTCTGLSIVPSEANDLNPYTDRVRIWWQYETGDQIPVGTFRFSDFAWRLPSPTQRFGLPSLADDGSRLKDTISWAVSYPTGASVGRALTDLLYLLGFSNWRIDDNGAVFGSPVGWPAGQKTWQDLTDYMCTLLGCYPIYCDAMGVPIARAVPGITDEYADFTYTPGPHCTVLSSSPPQEKTDTFNAPNRFIVVETSAKKVPIYAVYDLPPRSPNSFENIGRRITKSVSTQGLTSSSQALVAAKAAAAQQQFHETITFSTAPNPFHDGWALVRWADALVYQETAWSLTLAPEGPHQHTISRTLNT